MKVLLISMPFSSTKWPSIGISLLKPRLVNEGIACDIGYFNIIFARMIGLERYEDIALYPKYLMGERIFAYNYFGDKLPGDKEYLRYLKQACRSGYSSSMEELLEIGDFVESFYERCIEETPWQEYQIIGFTTMFEQNLASAGLARRLKERFPDKIILFGGANCEREMGIELHRQFPFIDYVCSGEADDTLPELVKRIERQEKVDDIPGVIYRRDGESILTSGSQMVQNLDTLPVPDYDDYFSQLTASSFSPENCYEIHMETSRGCWWGARSQCNFCGLNGHAIGFRAKSETRVLEELSHLITRYAKRYDLKLISMVDNVLSMEYFKELLPRLQQMKLPVHLFYEIKANLNKEQVQALHDAGIIWVQPGIESLNSHVLKLMGKGVTALQNVQLLKHCAECGVYPTWNIIYRSPGERQEDYREMIDLIGKIVHLVPPEGFIPLCLQRFSPYHNNPEKYGFTNVRPEESYRFLYPFSEEALANLAYFFEFQFTDEHRPQERVHELSEAVEYWRQCHERKEYLQYHDQGDRLLLQDERNSRKVREMLLEASHGEIYRFCDSIKKFQVICQHLRDTYPSTSIRRRDVREFLEEMVSLDLMAKEGERYLSLAIPFRDSLHQSPITYCPA